MPRTDAAPLTDVGLKALSPAELEYMNIIWQHPDGMSSEVLYGFFPNHALKTKRVILKAKGLAVIKSIFLSSPHLTTTKHWKNIPLLKNMDIPLKISRRHFAVKKDYQKIR